jgi:hypothetical protein
MPRAEEIEASALVADPKHVAAAASGCPFSAPADP